MSWKTQVPGTFGSMDLIFCSHPLDTDRALELLKECYKANISLSDVVKEVEKFLSSKGAGKDHITDQTDQVKDKFGGWLS